MPGITELTEAIARYYFELLTIKDEYDVARLSPAREHALDARLAQIERLRDSGVRDSARLETFLSASTRAAVCAMAIYFFCEGIDI